ncbi:MAG TPA: FGGY family carbohydrate kinase, partial [Clostridia bacterium]|nr:FGGY family carbohydrate kinase [Clostridia bacterium]
MNRYLLSIDNGLTETKAVLFDLVGKEIAISKAPTPVVNQGPRSEVDMDRQWDITASCIKGVISQSGIRAGQILAIGGSGHGAGAYLLDESLQP